MLFDGESKRELLIGDPTQQTDLNAAHASCSDTGLFIRIRSDSEWIDLLAYLMLRCEEQTLLRKTVEEHSKMESQSVPSVMPSPLSTLSGQSPASASSSAGALPLSLSALPSSAPTVAVSCPGPPSSSDEGMPVRPRPHWGAPEKNWTVD